MNARAEIPEARAMVDGQIAARGMRDTRILGAMACLPREQFVPPEARDEAYADHPVPIGAGQTISQPYIVAAMTAALGPAPTDHVLEVGTGSGYQTALLALLARSVVSIERHAALGARAGEVLAALGLGNISLVTGDGTLGYPAAAPYDAILVTAGAPEVPESLLAQLAEGGRLVCPVGSREEQRLVRVTRQGGDFHRERGERCLFVPLIGRAGWPPAPDGGG